MIYFLANLQCRGLQKNWHIEQENAVFVCPQGDTGVKDVLNSAVTVKNDRI